MKRRDPLSAARGIFNGVVGSVILWAALFCLLFYGFRISL